MATSSIERDIVITDPEAIKKLISILEDDTPPKPLSVQPYSEEERERGILLLRQCLSRSRNSSKN